MIRRLLLLEARKLRIFLLVLVVFPTPMFVSDKMTGSAHTMYEYTNNREVVSSPHVALILS